MSFRMAAGSSLQRSRTRGSAESTAYRVGHSTEECSFNGAALVGVRRAIMSTPERHIAQPFNGAALVGVRRASRDISQNRSETILQRSRTRGSAESTGSGGHGRRHGRPSTEPHSWECGESLIATSGKRVSDLQRSRTRGSAERLGCGVRWTPAKLLQRSRTRGSAERTVRFLAC